MFLFKFVSKSSCCVCLVIFSSVDFKYLSKFQFVGNITRHLKRRGGCWKKFSEKSYVSFDHLHLLSNKFLPTCLFISAVCRIYI
jgi:hypothetical protein